MRKRSAPKIDIKLFTLIKCKFTNQKFLEIKIVANIYCHLVLKYKTTQIHTYNSMKIEKNIYLLPSIDQLQTLEGVTTLTFMVFQVKMNVSMPLCFVSLVWIQPSQFLSWAFFLQWYNFGSTNCTKNNLL